MLKRTPQLINTLTPNSANPTEIVDYINSYIDDYSCENINIDISFMNVIDSCYVSTLCAAKHFTKYPNGKINWKISSSAVKEFNNALGLGNSHYEI